MKRYIYLLMAIFISTTIVLAQNNKKMNLYDFTVKDIDGNEFKMSQFKGKKVMIVNVASKCGLTPQYEQLEKVYNKYKDKGFTIVAFPANNFNNQEPGSNAEIKQFCSLEYDVSFPLMSKISVLGEDKAPIYKWLTEKENNGSINQEVTWNFQKYLIDREGNLLTVIMPKELPNSDTIISWIMEDDG